MTERLPGIALLIPSLCYGGAERQVVEIARNIDRSRYRVHIVTVSDFSPLLAEDDPLRGVFHVVERSPMLTLVPRLGGLLRELDIQLVHGFLFLTEIAGRLAGFMNRDLVVLGSERNTDYEMAPYRLWCLRATRHMTRRIVANSSAGARFNAGLYHLPDEHYEIVYNGVDTARFEPRDNVLVRESLGLDPQHVVIGMFASFKRQKNHTLLFAALSTLVARHPGLRLLLVGDTLLDDHGDTLEYKHEVRTALADSGLEPITQILGNRTDVEDLYNACDFTVLPSTREGTPNVVLESMACGVPAVVSDVSDNARLVTHGEDGFVVPVNDEDALCEHIRILIEEPSRLAAMQSAARQTAVSRLSTTTMADNMAAVYDRVLAERSA